jgi:crossover junction endodeoxyribonuclease RusA
VTLRLVLPVPPSANRWWRKFRNVMVLSAEARQYKVDVEKKVKAMGATKIDAPCEVAVSIEWWRARKSGDLDKRIGVLLDALQGTAYDNDSQIGRLEATKHDDDPKNARVEVLVKEFKRRRRRAA